MMIAIPDISVEIPGKSVFVSYSQQRARLRLATFVARPRSGERSELT